MSILRYLIGFVGLIGLALWLMLIAIATFFHGFKPGGPQGGPSMIQGWFCAATPVIAFVYYYFVAGSDWTPRMLFTGIAVHIALLASVATLVFVTDGGFLVAPGLLSGALLWTVYASFTSQSRQSA